MMKGRTPHSRTTQARRTTSTAVRRRVRPSASEVFSHALLVHALDLVYVMNATGTIRYVNPAITRLLGYQPADVQGYDTFSFVHPDDVPLLQEMMADILRQPGRIGQWEYRIRHTDGAWRVFAGTATNLLDTPAINGIVMQARDVTERSRADAKRLASEERYRLLFDTIADTIVVWTMDGIITEVNCAGQRLLGWKLEELIGQHYHTLFLPAAHVLADAHTRRALTSDGLDILVEMDLLHKEGTTVPVNVRLQPFRDRAGVVSVSRARALNLPHDTVLPERLLLAERITETMPDLLYVYDLHRHAVVYVNHQANLLGRTPEELQRSSQMLQDLVHPEDLVLLRDCYQRLRTERGPAQAAIEYRVRHVNGEWRWMADRVRVFHRTPDGVPVQVLGVAQDITERKRLEGLLHQRQIKPKDMGNRLRKFRDGLGMTQKEFGRAFGKYKTTQISTYETGATTIPTELLVSIWAKGFPLEVIFGAPSTEILEKTATYFSANLAERRFNRKVLESVVQRLQEDEDLIAQALRELALPSRGLQTEQQRLLTALGVSEEEETETGQAKRPGGS